MCYEEKIALGLAFSYNKNPLKDTYEITTKTIYPEYYSGEKNGIRCLDTEGFALFNRIIEGCIDRGIFNARQDKKTSVYKRVIATSGQVKHFAKLYNLTLLPEYEEEMRAILSRYHSSECQGVRDWVAQELGERNLANVKAWFKYDISGGVDEKVKKLEELLDTCEAIVKLREDVLMRNFSVSHAMGSKGFEQNIKKRACAILAPRQYTDGIDPNDILKSFHILQNPATVWIKGAGRIRFRNGDTITCSDCVSPLALTRDWVEHIDYVDINSLLTIENLTTFNDYHVRSDEFVVFTSGFANSLIIEFLCKCVLDNKLIGARHFGDLDAFGFEILRDLSCRTGIQIKPYLMNVSIYEANKAQAIEMTDENRTLFRKLLEDSFYSTQDKDLFRCLLEDGKTLEQEGISERG